LLSGIKKPPQTAISFFDAQEIMIYTCCGFGRPLNSSKILIEPPQKRTTKADALSKIKTEKR